MARIRTIKPDFFKNEDIADLDPMTRLLFIGLWTQSDREGKLEDRPRRLKAEIFPYEEFDVDKALDDLQKKELIIRYHVDELNKFLKVLTFNKHQQPNIKEAKSIIPEPENIQAQYKHSTDTVLASQERKGKEQEQEQEGKGKEGDRGRLRFSPPIFNEVLEFFILKTKEISWSGEKCEIQTKKFFDHYESNGWMVGKNKMSKWKSAVSGWINRDVEFSKNNTANNSIKDGAKNKSGASAVDRATVEYFTEKYGDINID